MQKTYKDWYLKPEIQQAQYLNLVNNALIPHYVKDYLRYIASKCSWAGTKDPTRSYSGCFARQDVQEIHMNRSSDYVGKAKRAALKLKWIQVKKRPGTSDEIFPTIGVDDPTMKQKFPRESWVRSDIKPIQLEINS
jgi:hypothetical protein